MSRHLEGHSLPAPEPAALEASDRLTGLIRRELAAAGGAIPFRRFMELALYAPGLGYYSGGSHKFGPGGDFVTAPELSPLFARCLARQAAQVLERLGGGRILELGAGSGVMAADLLEELERLDRLPDSYLILEISSELQDRQRRTLAERVPRLLDRVEWLDSLPQEGFRGVMVGNEVLDAMPVERFRVTADGPVPLEVAWQDGFVWREGSPDGRLATTVAAIEKEIGQSLPQGYESEFNPNLEPWLAALAGRLAAGMILLIDYGYPRREYYHPQRDTGTLLCHYRHRAHPDPLILPGLQDITANVDFTALADTALGVELEVAGYTAQAHFLIGCGLEELLARADPADTVEFMKLTRQVKLLTLPGEMGERFKAIALTRNLDPPWRGFGFVDERGRL